MGDVELATAYCRLAESSILRRRFQHGVIASNCKLSRDLVRLRSLLSELKNAHQHKPRPIIRCLYEVFNTDYVRSSLAAEISRIT